MIQQHLYHSGPGQTCHLSLPITSAISNSVHRAIAARKKALSIAVCVLLGWNGISGKADSSGDDFELKAEEKNESEDKVAEKGDD
jgi:hypothetical protein